VILTLDGAADAAGVAGAWFIQTDVQLSSRCDRMSNDRVSAVADCYLLTGSLSEKHLTQEWINKFIPLSSY